MAFRDAPERAAAAEEDEEDEEETLDETCGPVASTISMSESVGEGKEGGGERVAGGRGRVLGESEARNGARRRRREV